MSLINLLTDKVAGAVLAASRPLSKFTDTTFSQANTSLLKISTDVYNSAKNTIAKLGISNDSIISPITEMRDYAIRLDPLNTVAFNNAANTSINYAASSFTNNLPGLNNSIFDIQQSGREALGSAVSNFGSSLVNINPAIASSVTELGSSKLVDVGRITDNVCTSSFSAASDTLKNNINSVNNTVADKAQASIAAAKVAEGDTLPLPDANDDSDSEENSEEATEDRGVTSVEESPKPTDFNYTDVIYQEIKIYIEGVQVPYASCSVTQAIGQLPSASFQLPPQAGLMDIARYYQPKVHIFYVDDKFGGDRLLFWGHIIACNYSYSKQTSSANISFEAIHKNALMQQLTFEWSAGGSSHATTGQSYTNSDPNVATVQLFNFNSESSLIMALQGISGPQTEAKDVLRPYNNELSTADVTKLDEKFKIFEKRIIGMPASMMNIWNQVKKQILQDEKLNIIFSKMYMPLVEDGIAFFDRLSGHVFLENQIQQSKQEHCNDKARPELSKKIMLPPAYRMNTISAIQTQMAVNSLSSSLSPSGEMTSFFDLFMNFYYTVDYDMVTLASPAEVPVDPDIIADPDNHEDWVSQPRMAIETIVKPQLPFYYSPICNVLLPNMFHSVNVNQVEAAIPTRITAISTAAGQATNDPNSLALNYRAPQSIRESIAMAKKSLDNSKAPSKSTDTYGTLKETTGSSYSIPGKYELGRGIKHKKIVMPNWLTHLSAGNNEVRASKNDEQFPGVGTLEDKNLEDLRMAWIDRYGYSVNPTEGNPKGSKARDSVKDSLNPYARESDIMAYERLLFAAADYEYTREVVKSKNGNVECMFNPYIIPGYPMDIIAKSPNHPSFHGMCASVTHSFSFNYITTSVSFMAAITYTEMSNYFIQSIHPWLQNALKLVNVSRKTVSSSSTPADQKNLTATDDIDNVLLKENINEQLPDLNSTAYGLPKDANYDTNTGDVDLVSQTLIGNPRAKAIADNFYRNVLGIGAADPGQIFDFETGEVLPVTRLSGVWVEGSSSSLHTVEGFERNDNLTAMGGLRLISRPIEGKKAIESKFGIKFIDMIPENYTGTPAIYENTVLSNDALREPGASLFLDYLEVSEFIYLDSKAQNDIIGTVEGFNANDI